MSEETCSECDCFTGNAGIGEDSLHCDGLVYCDDCWQELPHKQAEKIAQQAKLIVQMASIDAQQAAEPLFADETPEEIWAHLAACVEVGCTFPQHYRDAIGWAGRKMAELEIQLKAAEPAPKGKNESEKVDA